MKTLLCFWISFLSVLPTFAASFSVDAGTDGFTGWTVSPDPGTGTAGTFTAASGTAIDTSGISWGLYGNTSDTGSATYAMPASLAVGETLSLDASIGFMDGGSTVGFALQNSTGTNRFEAYYIGGDATDAWKLNDAEGQENITGPAVGFGDSSWKATPASFLSFDFTLQSGNTYALSINGTPITNTGLNLIASDISQVRIFNFNAGSTPDNNAYFNNLSVVPEPSSVLFLIFGLGSLVYIRRRS